MSRPLPHVVNSDCDVDPASNSCRLCGVDHGGDCRYCGPGGFHAFGCADSDDTDLNGCECRCHRSGCTEFCEPCGGEDPMSRAVGFETRGLATMNPCTAGGESGPPYDHATATGMYDHDDYN